ncbi:MAG: WYL domain-containing protein [Bacteroidales bacterium]
MNQLISQTKPIQDRILFEKTNPNPQYLLLITEAMTEYSVIELTYRPYGQDAKTRKVKPLCLKNFRQRWYVVVQVIADERIIIYALDERVEEIRKTGEPFKMPKGFNAEEYFKNSFGIMVMSDISPTLIKIRVTDEKAKYLRSLPLHHTQEEESNDGKGIIFSYYLIPAYDFKMELLRHGKDLEVIYPASLRNKIADIVKETVKLYQ